MAARKSEAPAAVGTRVGPGQDLVLRISRRQLAGHDRDHVLVVRAKADVEVPFVLRHVAAATARDRVAVARRRHLHHVDGVLRVARLIAAAHPRREVRLRPRGRIDGVVKERQPGPAFGEFPDLRQPAGLDERVHLAAVRKEYDRVDVIQRGGIRRPAIVIDIDLQRLDVRRLLQALLHKSSDLIPLVIAFAVAGLAGQEGDLLGLRPGDRRQTRRPAQPRRNSSAAPGLVKAPTSWPSGLWNTRPLP